MDVNFDRFFRVSLITLGILLIVTMIVSRLVPSVWMAVYFFQKQDVPVTLLWVAALVGLQFSVRRKTFPDGFGGSWLSNPVSIFMLAIAAVMIGWAGSNLVMGNFPLSVDEVWAVDDGSILAHGALRAVIAPEWFAYRDGLFPKFTRYSGNGTMFSSDYLPINAAIQYLLGHLASPIMAGLSVLLTAAVAKKLVPDSRTAPIIAALFLATSSQLLITAMTPYAMSAHLFFNMLWVWLLLRNSLAASISAAVTAIVAMGLHQATFFPLFAAPFLLEAFLTGRRKLAVAQFVIIAAGFLAWANYDTFVQWVYSLPPEPGGQESGAGMVADLVHRIQSQGVQRFGLMAANFLRLIVWQNPAVAPLAILGSWAVFRQTGYLRAMLGGIVLTSLFMFIVIPFQGHGWGYRYLHGCLGSIAILATFAFSRLETNEMAGNWRFINIASAVFAVLVLLPIHAFQAYALTEPYRRASAEIDRMNADVVVVDARKFVYAEDLVRNDPYLRNTPIRLSRARLYDAQLAELCRTHPSLKFFTNEDAKRFRLHDLDSLPKGRPLPAECAEAAKR